MYVDAIIDRKSDTIHIAERRDGKRVLLDRPAEYVFYYEDSSGSHRSIFGHPCRRFSAKTTYKFHAGLRDKHDRRIFESDVNPVSRALAADYQGVDAPVMHLGFFDIEVAFDQERGFAQPNDPFNPITAITLYRSADKKLLTLLLRPLTLRHSEAMSIVEQFEDTLLFDDEIQLLLTFLDAIDDVDCLTGWNSSAYDIPYVVNRIAAIIDKQTAKRLCLWDQAPSPRQYKNKFGRMVDTYDLVGRVHLDYLDLFAKHNPQQRLSYRLDAIAESEVGENKVPYEGTLDDLYKKDFDQFIKYNRQDVMLMVKIDRKFKYIELANQVAHSNYVTLKTTMGSVALVEQAIINEMHDIGFVVPNRKAKDDPIEDQSDIDIDEDDDEAALVEDGRTPVVGAYVAQPKTGLQDEVGSVDINSLYPSAIRALNMSPETLVGQVRLDQTMQLVRDRASKLTKTKRAEAWDGLFSTVEVAHMHERNDNVVTVDFFDLLTNTVSTETMTGRQLYEYIFNPANHRCITANGTIFRTDVEGMIPQLLGKWYAQRKEMQANQKEWEKKAEAANSPEAKAEAAYWVDFWNQRQQARKILLNSLYGALLNEGLRFYDERLGQSVTLTGRSIVRHMNARINELITGDYDYRGEAIVYADTDSCYFSVATYAKTLAEGVESGGLTADEIAALMMTHEDVIALYDTLADATNETFPAFMQETFNTSLERGAIIRAGRELLASRGLFIKKKKYACLMIDKEGTRLDVDGKAGKLKVMGLDLKRSDTPLVMQQFLSKLLMDLLTGRPQEQMYDDIKAFRQTFKARPGWEKGSPKKVANLAFFTTILANDISVGGKMRRDEKRITIPGHVRASFHWNLLRDIYSDRYSQAITDSARVIVCKLKNNTFGMTSIAYPTDEPHLPSWFRALPFDDEAMEETIVDNKLLNLVSVLDWDLTETKERMAEQFFTW